METKKFQQKRIWRKPFPMLVYDEAFRLTGGWLRRWWKRTSLLKTSWQYVCSSSSWSSMSAASCGELFWIRPSPNTISPSMRSVFRVISFRKLCRSNRWCSCTMWLHLWQRCVRVRLHHKLTLSCWILWRMSLSEKCSTFVSCRSSSVNHTSILSLVPSNSSLWLVKY